MSIVLAGLIVISVLGGEPAATGQSVDASDVQSAAAKPLVVCDRDEASRRAFRRQFGRVEFVTAQGVLDGRGDGQRWETPRCITPVEFAKLRRLTGIDYAQIDGQ